MVFVELLDIHTLGQVLGACWIDMRFRASISALFIVF